jgi:hypothetical protein
MEIKIKQVKEESELFYKINNYSTKTFYISILLQLVLFVALVFLVHNIFFKICINIYLFWLFISMILINKIVANFSFKNLLHFPIFITITPIIFFYYFLFRNKYPASTDPDYLKNFHRMRKIKNIL